MLTKFVIKPYSMASKSAKFLSAALSNYLGYKVKRVRGSYVPRRNETVIHWGKSAAMFAAPHDHNVDTSVSRSKLESFHAFEEHNVPCPEWTVSQFQAQVWSNDGHTVVVRKDLYGKGGSGIIVVNPGETVPIAPLYTKYKKKMTEYRAHVVSDKVIEVVEKRRKAGYSADSKIRNHSNGWVFCKTDVFPPDDLCSVAINAVKACGLKFGAVDIIYNKHENKCYALEVNSAPGFEGSTVEKYAVAFSEVL